MIFTKFEAGQLISSWLITFLLLIRCVRLWPWLLTFTLKVYRFAAVTWLNSVPNVSKIEHSADELLRFLYAQFWDRLPSWIYRKLTLKIIQPVETTSMPIFQISTK